MLKTIIDDCGFNITKKTSTHTRGCWCDGEPLVTNDEYFEKGSKFRFFFQETLLFVTNYPYSSKHFMFFWFIFMLLLHVMAFVNIQIILLDLKPWYNF